MDQYMSLTRMWGNAQRDGHPAEYSWRPLFNSDGAQMVNFWRPVLSASRMQHVSDLHLKFALRPHHVWKYGRHPVCDG